MTINTLTTQALLTERIADLRREGDRERMVRGARLTRPRSRRSPRPSPSPASSSNLESDKRHGSDRLPRVRCPGRDRVARRPGEHRRPNRARQSSLREPSIGSCFRLPALFALMKVKPARWTRVLIERVRSTAGHDGLEVCGSEIPERIVCRQ